MNPRQHLAWLTLTFVALGAGALVEVGHLVVPVLRLEPALSWISVGIAGGGVVAALLGLRKPDAEGEGTRISRASVLGGVGNLALVVFGVALALYVAPLPQTDFAFAVGDELPEFQTPLTDTDGNEVRLADQDGPTVLVFYRGGWCPFCTAHLTGLNDGFDEISRRATLLAVSPDLPAAVRKYAASLDLPFALLSDGGARIASQYGLSHPGPFQGDIPRPATIILDGDRRIRWFHVSTDVRDRASTEDILRELDALEGSP